MKDYTVKQSLIIVASACALLVIALYLFTPLFKTAGRSKAETTRLEEEQLANAISQYATVFTNFPPDDNASLTKALTGDNPQQVKFLDLIASSTNQDGRMVDIWNTPYKFNFISTNRFTITSAGTNLMFGDADDIVFDTGSNALGDTAGFKQNPVPQK